jgi:hypothetical protein
MGSGSMNLFNGEEREARVWETKKQYDFLQQRLLRWPF